MINGFRFITRIGFFSICFLSILQLRAQDKRSADSLENILRKGGISDEKKATLLNKIAKACLHADDNKAFTYADSAIIFATKINNNKIKSECYSLQGMVYKDKGEFQNAIDKYLKALALKEEDADSMGISSCYNSIGILYKVMENYDKALTYYKKSNILCRKINFGKGIAQTYSNIGTVFAALHMPDSSLVYYKKALTIAEEIHNNAAISTACNNIGQYYGDKNMLKEAMGYLKRCLEIDTVEGNVYGMILSYTNIGILHIRARHPSEGLSYLTKAEKLCMENGQKPMLRNLYKAMSDSYAFIGDKNNAYDYLVKFKNISDTLQTEEISKNILEVETKYQTAKKDLEIEKNKAELVIKEEQAHVKNSIIGSIILVSVLLMIMAFIFYRKEKIKQRAKQEAELSAQKDIRARAIIEAEEKERVRIAKDLHDGIGQLLSAAKMNLSSIESTIGIKGPVQESAFKNALDLLDESVKEVRAVSHNMMPNTLIKLGLASAVKEFITKIQNMPDLKVSLEIIGMNERLEQEKESILYRVIQEIVSNIIKHAKASELVLQLIRHEKELTVSVEDNGVGFDTSKINDFDGIGLKNIISRVEFLNGTVHFDSTVGKGTNISIDIPVS